MFVSWLGGSALKIEYKDGEDTSVLLLDPYQLKEQAMPRSLAAQVVLLTRGEEDMITLAKDPYIISHPGEYETHSVAVVGIANPGSTSAPVLYRFSAEELSIGHLGMLDSKPSDAILGEFDGVDVLFVPAGDEGGLSLEAAAEIITQIEPRVVIPICFTDIALFAKEMGMSNIAPEERIRLRKKDLPVDTTVIMVPAKS